MLDLMRRHSQSYLIYFFFAVLIFVFVFFFGPQSDGCTPKKTAAIATIDDVVIGSPQVDQLYGRVYQRENRNTDVTIPAPIRKRALTEDLVMVHLLAREARLAGLDVSDAQLTEYVQGPTNPDRYYYFDDRTQQFDLERYELGVPGNFGMPINQYERFKADELLATEYIGLLQESIAIAPSEVENLYRLRNREYTLEYVQFESRDFAEYLGVPDSAIDEILANDLDRVRAYYDEHIEDYTQEPELRFSRILLQVDAAGGSDAADSRRATYEEVLAGVTDDPSTFADMASTHSDGSEAVVGGDLGWKPATNYELFSGLENLGDLEEGELVTYESDTSFIIYRFEEAHGEVVTDFGSVSADVARTILEAEQGDSPLRGLAESFLTTAQANDNLEAALAALSTELDGELPSEQESDGEEEVDGQDPVEGDDEPADDEPTDDDAADAPVRITDLVEVEETRPFSIDRPDPFAQFGGQFTIQGGGPPNPEDIPGLGTVPRLARVVSQLTEESPVAPEVYELNQAFVVARLVEVASPDEEIDEETYQSLRNELRNERAQYLFGDWQARMLGHQQGRFGPYLQHLLDSSFESGVVEFDEYYFEYVPEPATEDDEEAQL